MYRTPVTEPHLLLEDEISGDGTEASALYERFKLLGSLGLVERVPYLFDGPAGEPVHPMYEDSDIQVERELFRACSDAGWALLNDTRRDRADELGGFIAPVPAHIGQVQVFDVYRLRYRPHTRLTAAWWADHQQACAEYMRRYSAISSAEGEGSMDEHKHYAIGSA